MKSLCLFLSFVFSFVLMAQDIYVDFAMSDKKGRSNPGTKTMPTNFETALKRAKSGDTICILPADKMLYGSLAVQDKSGITIDGMNNIFTGSKPVAARDWKEVTPGLFKKEAKNVPNFIERIYFIHNDRAVRMGRFTKGGKMKPFKAVDDLQPGEWTVVDASPDVQAKNNVKKRYDYYIRLGEGETDLKNWQEPVMQDGVRVRGNCTDIKFKNIIVTHFKNDGFNIHGDCKNIAFENVAAVECGDDGISAHKGCTITVKNFVGLRNSTGICHIQNVQSTHDNVYLEGNLGTDFFMMPNASGKLTNACGFIGARNGIRIASGGKVEMANCTFVGRGKRARILFSGKKLGTYTFKNVTVNGFNIIDKRFTGITKDSDAAKCEKAVMDKKAELFALFSGNLEKISE